MYEQTILCLANSRKPPQGRCIAGKVWTAGAAGAWLRPVSERPTHEVSEADRRYPNGRLAQVLDIITMPLLRPSPFDFQQENHVLHAAEYWQKIGAASWANVLACVDGHDAGFWAHSQSTQNGLNDKISEADVLRFRSSLKLIHVSDLELRVQFEDGWQGKPGKKKVRGRFTYQRQTYILSVSDAEFEDAYLQRGEGVYPVGDAVLCISLVEVFHGFSFRVIASLITQQRCEAAHA